MGDVEDAMRGSVAQMVAGALAVLLSVVGAIGLVVLAQTRRLGTDVEAVAATHQVRVALSELLLALTDAEGARRDYALTGDTAYLASVRAAVAAVPHRLEALDSMTAKRPIQRARYERLAPLIVSRLRRLESDIGAARDGGRPAPGGDADLAVIRDQVTAMDTESRRVLGERVARARRAERTTMQVAGAGSLLALLVAILGVVVIRAELAARQRAQERLRASDARFRAAVEGGLDAFFLLDAVRDDSGRVVDFRFSEVNARGAELLGRPRTEIVGRSMLALFPDAVPLGFFDRYARVLTAGDRLDEEFAVLVPGVRAEWLHHAVTRLGDGLAITAQDVTQRRRLEEQLRLSQKMEALGRLATGVAHDFNNILAAIRVSCEMVAMTLAPDDAGRDDLAEAGRQVDRARQLTRQLLAFSRRQESRPVPLDLNAVVDDMEGLLRRTMTADVRVAAHLAPDAGLVRADPSQLDQVLLNLALNARDAMPHGGTIEIETRNEEVHARRSYSHGVMEPGRYTVLVVRDSGIGMDAETMGHLFEPFFTTKPEGKGSGLGLPTSFGIVRQAGGHMFVESEPGRGTTVSVYLPRSESEPRGTMAAGTHEAGGVPDGGADDGRDLEDGAPTASRTAA